jgi:sugar/nucleoside kinase (ribokinase family)
MRPLAEHERRLIERLAANLDVEDRRRLLGDLACARVAEERGDGACLIFDLDGYVRPDTAGQRLYPVEAETGSGDTVMTILLYSDANGRLLELEFIGWIDGTKIDPRWSGLRIW